MSKLLRVTVLLPAIYYSKALSFFVMMMQAKSKTAILCMLQKYCNKSASFIPFEKRVPEVFIHYIMKENSHIYRVKSYDKDRPQVLAHVAGSLV